MELGASRVRWRLRTSDSTVRSVEPGVRRERAACKKSRGGQALAAGTLELVDQQRAFAAGDKDSLAVSPNDTARRVETTRCRFGVPDLDEFAVERGAGTRCGVEGPDHPIDR